MAKQFNRINEDHARFIAAQHIFFSGTAAAEGRVNISPKGMDSLRVMDPNRIVWRNLTGSGNETAGHLRQMNRMTLMWCSFAARPLILRAYGSARTLHPRDPEFAELNALFPANPGPRQIYDMNVEMIQTSCGYAVPFLDYAGERDTLDRVTEPLGQDGLHTFWAERNLTTIDGQPSNIFGDIDDAG